MTARVRIKEYNYSITIIYSVFNFSFTYYINLAKIKEKDRQITALMRDRSKLLNELKVLKIALYVAVFKKLWLK